MLHKGFDVKTVAERGGWKDATTVLRTYAHAIKDKTVTDVLFDTPVTQDAAKKRSTNRRTGVKRKADVAPGQCVAATRPWQKRKRRAKARRW